MDDIRGPQSGHRGRPPQRGMFGAATPRSAAALRNRYKNSGHSAALEKKPVPVPLKKKLQKELRKYQIKYKMGRTAQTSSSLLLICMVFIVSLLVFANKGGTSALEEQDGMAFYGESTNTTPEYRQYSSGAFGSQNNGPTAAATIRHVQIEAAPNRNEMIAAVQTTGGTLYIQRWDGSSWSNEWNVTVGDGPLPRFSIAYEQSSGDAMVLYGANVATTNELRYRIWNGSSWTTATNLDAVRTSGTIYDVVLKAQPGADRIAAAWADSNDDLSVDVWTGSAWEGEPPSPATTSLATTAASATPNTQAYDLAWGSLSGNLMAAWGAGTSTAGPSYAIWTVSGSWGAPTANSGFTEESDDMQLSADPNSDYIAYVGSSADSGNDGDVGIWDGSAWGSKSNFDTTLNGTGAGTISNTVNWIKSGSETRAVVAYDDAAASGVDWLVYNKNTPGWAVQTDYTGSPAAATTDDKLLRLKTNPFNSSELMLVQVDANSDLFLKKLNMSGTTLTWSSVDPSGASAETSVSSITGFAADYAYNKYVPPPTYTQSAYQWFQNADSVQPGSSRAAINTSISLASASDILRLRMGLTVGINSLKASNQAFRLQYSTNTSGPWYNVDDGSNDWCNATSGVTCNSSWTKRRKITFNNAASTTDLTNFPVLVKVDSTRIDYANTQNSGQDIRFVDPSNPNTVLPHEIEKWDETGTSYVWVKVPTINAASTTDSIWMYYGNGSASDGQDAANVWTGYAGVWHMNKTSGTETDSTSNASNGTVGGSPTRGATGMIGGAYDFTKTAGQEVSIADPVDGHLDFGTADFSYSMWVQEDTLPAASNWQEYLSKGGNNSATAGYMIEINSSNQLYGMVTDGGGSGTLGVDYQQTPFSSITLSSWTYLTVVGDRATQKLYIYKNGAVVGTSTSLSTIGSLSNSLALKLGEGGGSTVPMDGRLDEVRIKTGTLSTDWINAEYLTDTDSMNTFGTEQVYPGVTSSSWCNASSGVTCNTNWTNRRAITFNNSNSTTNLTNFPVLVKLNSSRIDYSQTQNSGQDIRFVDPADPTVVLPYEIEKWDETGTSYVWVKVPQIDAASSTDSIWMYYGNGSASNGQQATSVWDSNYTEVLHMKGDGTTTLPDSTSNAKNATKLAIGGPANFTAGEVSEAQDFDNVDDYAKVTSPNLPTADFSYEAWVNLDTATDDFLFEGMESAGGTQEFLVWVQTTGKVEVWTNNTARLVTGVNAVPAGGWHNIAVTRSGSAITLYVDGVASTFTGTDAGVLNFGTCPFLIGVDSDGGCETSLGNYLDGRMDEARVSSTARSADWIKAEYLTDTDAMNTYGAEEQWAGSTSAWQYKDNATPLSGAAISSTLLTGSTVLESYQELNLSPLNPSAIGVGGVGEWDFALDPLNASPGTTYYFRMVKANGVALGTYSVYPTLTTLPGGGPGTPDIMLRQGNWFHAGVEQGYDTGTPPYWQYAN